MTKYCPQGILVVILITFSLVLSTSSRDEDLLKELQDFNKWAEENKNNDKYKAKEYQPRVETLNADEEATGGIEALKFMRMYRYNHYGDIPDKMKLFKDFFDSEESIPIEKFYIMAAVWLKRTYFEMNTGVNYSEQQNIKELLENTHAVLFAKEELKKVRVLQLYYEFDRFFRKHETIELVEAVHFLVDGNLYAEIGPARIKEIFEDELDIVKDDTLESEEDKESSEIKPSEDEIRMNLLDDMITGEEEQVDIKIDL